MPPARGLLRGLLRPAAPGGGPGAAGRPLLAVDVDGVISLMGEGEPDPGAVRCELFAGRLHCISLGAGDSLRTLTRWYELIWASGWEAQECDSLAKLLGLVGIPHLSFGSQARFGSAHWKIGELDRIAEGRPLAWVDDNLDERCREWASGRQAPTLLVPTRPERGLEPSHGEQLVEWARKIHKAERNRSV